MPRSHAFSRASRQLHVITSSFDWFTVLFMSFVIGQSDYVGVGLRHSIGGRSKRKLNQFNHSETLHKYGFSQVEFWTSLLKKRISLAKGLFTDFHSLKTLGIGHYQNREQTNSIQRSHFTSSLISNVRARFIVQIQTPSNLSY